MRKYKVAPTVLSVGGLNNKIFRTGDVCWENNFHEGRAEKLVEDGHLVHAEENKGDEPPPNSELKSFYNCTEEFLTNDLTERGIKFKPNSDKLTLYRLWIKAVKPKAD